MAQNWEKELVDGLIEAGDKNVDLEGKGKEARHEAMENIALPIAEAIKKGSTINVKGSATVREINEMEDVQDGDMWAVKDGGVIVNKDGTVLEVDKGDLVRYEDGAWSRFLHLDLSGYVTEDYFNDVIAAINAAIIGHAENKLNPHDVTAEQVGAYTKAEVDAKIAEVEKNHLDMCVNSDVVEFFTVAS